MPSREQGIFKQASATYYWSSRFFPKDVRDDVFKLYSFVRTADDYVDARPAQRAHFKALRHLYEAASADPHFDTAPLPADTTDERVVKNMVYVCRKHAFDQAWVEAFLDSMQADLDGKTYQTLDDTLWYVHGSAEVIGLMMAKLMNLSPEAYEAAELQGRAMQYINFIRDIAEDTDHGRCYFPAEDLARFDLTDLKQETLRAKPKAFQKFVQFELNRYHDWQSVARTGFHHIPRRQRIAVRTAVDMYDWTARQIAARPHRLLEHKIKPSKRRVVLAGLRRLMY